RMSAIVTDSQNLARRALKCPISNVAIRPFNQYRLQMRLYRRWIDGWSHRISIEFKGRETGVAWDGRSRHVRFFDMYRIKFAVFCITGVERHADQAGRIAGVRHKLRKYFRKSDIWSEFFARFIQDV